MYFWSVNVEFLLGDPTLDQMIMVAVYLQVYLARQLQHA